MEKISGILPATARITTVDLQNSGKARSGTPGFGREVGVSAAAEKNAVVDAAAKANFAHKNQMIIRNEEGDPKAAIVKKMSDSFFIDNAKRREIENANKETEMRVNMLEENQVENSIEDDAADNVEQDSAASSAPSDQPSDDSSAVGHYLNVHA